MTSYNDFIFFYERYDLYMISIVTAIITVLGTYLIKKLTKSSSEIDEKRFTIYKHLDFDFKRKYNEKEYLYYADCYSFLCDKVANDVELIYLYDKISLVYLKRINYFYSSLVKNGSTNSKFINNIFIKLLKICINKFHHNVEKQLISILNNLGYPTSSLKGKVAYIFIFISVTLGSLCFSYSDLYNLFNALSILKYIKVAYFIICILTLVSAVITMKLFNYLM